MKASCEISLYPLHENYKEVIIAFIQRIKKHKNIKVETNGLSTQLFGDYDLIMDVIKVELKKVYEEHKAVLIFKMAKGERTRSKLPKILK